MALLLDWTVATEEALTAAQTRMIVYDIEKNFDQLEKNHIVDGRTLTHADVYLLLSIYAFELYRFLCGKSDTSGRPAPRNVIPDFLNRSEVAEAIKGSDFMLFTGRTGSPRNLFENVMRYYSGQRKGACRPFRNVVEFLKSPLTAAEQEFVKTTPPTNPDKKRKYHILRFRATCQNLDPQFGS